MVQMREAVSFRNHLCISFELLSINLYDYIKANSFKGSSLRLIRSALLTIVRYQHMALALALVKLLHWRWDNPSSDTGRYQIGRWTQHNTQQHDVTAKGYAQKGSTDCIV